MPAIKIDGTALAKQIRSEIAAGVQAHVASGGQRPGLAAVLVGENPASEVYVRNKRKACEDAGMNSWLHRLPADAPEAALLQLIETMNADAAVSGILIQLPLPRHMNEERIINAVHPLKDVDAFHPENIGLLTTGHPRFLPCTPFGCQQMLQRYHIPTAGKNVVVVGRSNIVGKPISLILCQKPSHDFPEAGDATVTIAHSRSADLGGICRQADIVIAAVGVPRLITGAMIRPGAAVIDVGINSIDGKLVGDVDAESVAPVAGWLSPVPGGVGPMTITMLLQNTLKAAKLRAQDI